MTDKDKDRIECAIRHIDSCLDVDPWARDIAIDAMQRLLEQASCRQVTGTLDIWDALSRVYNMPDVPDEAKSIIGDDLISRQSAYETLTDYYHHTTQTQHDALRDALSRVPSVPEPEITDEQAILHLQSTGWMQNHDREMYESGVREQLADDSGSYDSIISCKDAIVRLPSVQHTATWELDEQQEHVEKIWHCSNCGYRAWGSYEKTDFCGGCGADMRGEQDEIV